MKMVKLKSKDGEKFEVGENCLDRSKLFIEFKDIWNLEQEIMIKGADGKTLSKVIEYLKYHVNEEPKEIPKPLPGPDLKPILSEWDYNYISPPPLEDVVNLVNAANYLDISDLINLASARLASEMINCPVEEARKKFGIKTDMTEEEKAEYDKYPID